MINRLASFIFACVWVCAIAQAQTATNISFSGTSHSITNLFYTTSSNANYSRVRYVPAPASCAGLSGGTVMGFVGGGGGFGGKKVTLGGLNPSTTYNVCIEYSGNNVTWTSGGTASVTTLAVPGGIHPAVPVAPKTFTTDYPSTSGYNAVTLSSDCSNWRTLADAAQSSQTTAGTIITVPHTNTCSGKYWFTQRAADAVGFAGSAVNVANNTLNLPSHGLSEGEGWIYAKMTYQSGGVLVSPSGAACWTPDDGNGNCLLPSGTVHYVHVVDANNIQLYANAPLASGGKLIIFAGSYGGGSSSNFYVRYTRPNLKWIIVRTDTADASFVPEHVQVTPKWAAKLSPMRAPVSSFGAGTDRSAPMIQFYNADPGEPTLAGNIRFVGLDLSYPTNPNATTSIDPRAGSMLFATGGAQNIIFDRCWIHGQPPPGRMYVGMEWDGINLGLVDNWFDDLTHWTAVRNGFGIFNPTSSQFKINPGKFNYQANKSATLSSQVTVNLSGSASGSAFTYYTMDGQLNISLPPGISGTCSGAPCHIFTTDSNGAGVFTATGGAYPSVGDGVNSYAVDPVFSLVSSGGTTTSILDDQSLYVTGGAGSYELGTRFQTTSDGFVRAIRFNKPSGDSASTHVVTLWDSSGTILARTTSSSEPASGWVSTTITPVSITHGRVYTVSYQVVNAPFWFNGNLLQNRDYGTGPAYALAKYSPDNGCMFGDCGNASAPKDNWPKDSNGRTAAAPIGVLAISSGSITRIGQNGLMAEDTAEACNCMISTDGPGPWMAINNHIEGAGNMWHHQEGTERGDFTYRRNIFMTPSYADVTKPTWDGFRYFQRQLIEWKGGHRIQFDGNTIDTTFNDVAHNGLAMTFYNIDIGTSDVDITNNEFRHVPGLFEGPKNNSGPAPFRYRIKNNLAYNFDINLSVPTYISGDTPDNGTYDPTGWVSSGGNGMEDFILDHNTFLNLGRLPTLLSWSDGTHSEGLQVTNNIFTVDDTSWGVRQEPMFVNTGATCEGKTPGEGILTCYVAPGTLTFKDNVMIPNTSQLQGTAFWGYSTTVQGIKDHWPTLWSQNYIATSGNFGNLGFFNFDPAYQTGDYHLRSNYCSGCGQPATDGMDVGADIDVLRAAKGSVRLSNARPSNTTATVTFVAPDSQACPVDYATSDANLITSFTRVSDSDTSSRVRNVSITGLTAATVYFFRVNCAAEQPTGKFRTTGAAVATPPTISSFTASPTSITSGGSSTLSWTTSGATSLSISTIGTVTGTSRSVSPTSTTTYTLTATNAAGSTTATATVTVTGTVPVISSFTASPTSITSGGSSTLSWTVSGATSLSISPTVGTVTGTTSTSVAPGVTTTYTLTATNATGNATGTATVTVTSSSLTAPSQAGSFTTLTFDDEFSTALDIDPTNVNSTNHKWWGGVMFACSPPAANMTTSNGVLDLKWTAGQGTGSGCSYNDTTYDSTIMTHNHTSTMTAAAGQTFKYGYFEMRSKFDVGPYTWSAFWLDGEYGTGATFAELDIFEAVNADGGFHLYGTLHSWPGNTFPDNSNLLPTPGGTDFSQYHTYGFYWSSTQVKWYFDGVLMRTATPPPSASSGPPLYLMLSMQMGNNWSTFVPPNGTPAYNHNIDYVRVWQ